MIRPAEPAPFQLGSSRPNYAGSDLRLEAGAGVGRVFEVTAGKAKLANFSVTGPDAYKPGDDYSAIATLTGDGNSYKATRVHINGCHVAFRICDGDHQDVCLKACIVDGRNIGVSQDWVFGVLGRTAGKLTIGGESVFTRGGSHTNPNKSHRIYIGRECSLAIDGMHSYGNWAGREIQCYDGTPEEIKGKTFRKPAYWHVRNTVIERLALPAGQLGSYHAIESNPLICSEFEDCHIANDYACILAKGDVRISGGVLEGAGAGVRAFRDGITIELHGVENRCKVPVDTAGHSGVKVVRS